MTTAEGLKGELEHTRRIADMLCSGHAHLRERYACMALILDLAILGLSSWLTALAFVAPRFNVSLTPFGLDPQLWIGLLSVATLFLAIVQLKASWKGRSDAHRRTFEIYADVKHEVGRLLASGELDMLACRQVLARYDMATAIGTEMPERFFLCEKRRHKMKVAVSQHLDTHPGASIMLTRLRFWFRDNFGKSDPHA